MKTEPWNRADQVRSIAGDVWRYLTDAVIEEDAELEAAALFGMDPHEVRTLARVHFVLSKEVEALLDGMPRLVRRLTTTTALERESSPESIRGPIRWGPTLSERLATGLPHLYVTNPARRAFQTAENEALVGALNAVKMAARDTGWRLPSSRGVGAIVRRRGADADRWLQTRMLAEIERRPISSHVRSRVRTGRAARRYGPALDVLDLHAIYLRRNDRHALRQAIEQHALLVAPEDKLLELKVAFGIERSLRELGWDVGHPGLIQGGRLLTAKRPQRRITVFYQVTPKALISGSLYREIQQAHLIRAGGMIPDFVIRVDHGSSVRWLLVEVKGVHSPVEDLARRAVRDLLTYRRAFAPVLARQSGVYGLGVAWGSELAPAEGAEVFLCTPDTIRQALALFMDEGAVCSPLIR